MNKQEFIARLRDELYGLPQDDVEERVLFYSEMIDDRMEEGFSEEAAVCEIGDVGEIVSQIVAEIPLPKLVKEKVRPKRALKSFEIIMLILGSPIWLSVLIALIAVVLAVYISVWSVIISLWAIEFSLIACSLAGIVATAIFALKGAWLTGIALLGAGISGLGLAILLFFGCKAVTNGILLFTKSMALGIKTLFVGKEKAQ